MAGPKPVENQPGHPALPTAEADLIRRWTLDGADLATVDRRCGGHNQLGHTPQLCAFRYPGRLLRPGEAIPEPALRFVAECPIIAGRGNDDYGWRI